MDNIIQENALVFQMPEIRHQYLFQYSNVNIYNKMSLYYVVNFGHFTDNCEKPTVKNGRPVGCPIKLRNLCGYYSKSLYIFLLSATGQISISLLVYKWEHYKIKISSLIYNIQVKIYSILPKNWLIWLYYTNFFSLRMLRMVSKVVPWSPLKIG